MPVQGDHMHVFSLSLASILSLVTLTLASPAMGQSVHGVLRVVKGEVQIKSARTGQTTRARLGAQVFPKDVIITGKDSRAKVVMVDNNELNLSPDSHVEIQQYDYDPKKGKKDVLLNVIYGKVRAKVEQKYDGKTSKFQVKTPAAVAGVRGTDFITSFDRQTKSSQVITFHGKVDFGLPGPGGTIRNPVSVTPGKMAASANGQAPSAPQAVPKNELNSLDNDSKADSPTAGPSDSAGKSDGAKSGEDSAKSEGNASEGSGPEGESAGGGKAAPSTDTNVSGADGGSTGTDAREPASAAPVGGADSTSSTGPGSGPVTGAAPPPPGGASMIGSGDIVGGNSAPVMIPTLAPPMPLVALPPPITTTPVQSCLTCNELIQQGNTKVNITIKKQ